MAKLNYESFQKRCKCFCCFLCSPFVFLISKASCWVYFGFIMTKTLFSILYLQNITETCIYMMLLTVSVELPNDGFDDCGPRGDMSSAYRHPGVLGVGPRLAISTNWDLGPTTLT